MGVETGEGQVMLLAGQILLGLVALVSSLLLAVVVIPFVARGRGVLRDDEVSGVIEGTWLFGAAGFAYDSERGAALRLFGRPVWHFAMEDEEEKKQEAEPEDRSAEAQKKRRRSKKSARQWLAWLRAHRATLLHLGGRLLGTLRLRLRLSGRLGLEDPADTAMVVTGLRAMGGLAEWAVLEVEPDFLDDEVDLEGEASARAWGLAVVWVLFCALFEVRTWRMLRGLI
jgi:hypothetical protein